MQLLEGPERLAAIAYAHNRVVGEDMRYESKGAVREIVAIQLFQGKVSLQRNISTVKSAELQYNLRMYAFSV